MSSLRRRPGNRVVRKRLDAQSVIPLPEPEPSAGGPTNTVHARTFVAAVVVVFFIGAILLMLPIATVGGRATDPIDALFVSMSALSVTGLVTVDTQAHWSLFGQIVILLLVQLGGFGFMAGTTIVLVAIGRGTSLRSNLMMQDGSPAMSLRDVSQFSFRIVRFMLIVEAIGAVVLTLAFWRDQPFPRALWAGIFYAVSSFCNAGFDLQGEFGSLGEHHNSPALLLSIGILVQFGALSYMVLQDVWEHRRWRKLHLDTKLVLLTNGAIIIIATVLFLLVEWNGAMAGIEREWKPLNAFFQAIGARTSGFSSVGWDEANSSTMYVWIALMMVGGAAGSTTGGVKLATIAVIAVAVLSTVRGRDDPQAFGRRMSPQLVYRAMSIMALFLATHFMLSLALVITEDILNADEFSFLSLMFEAMSALATVGLSTGVTNELSAPGKAVVIIGMFVGRLGPITVAYALQNRQRRDHFRYPEANIRIG